MVFDAISISTNSAPMRSSRSVKLRYEKCLVNWGNTSFAGHSPEVKVGVATELKLETCRVAVSTFWVKSQRLAM